MCFFHRWGKWEQYDKEVPKKMVTESRGYPARTLHMQRIKCLKCGKVIVETLDETVKEF